MKIGLVGCVKTKQSRPAPARDLYKSPLFRGRRQWVESTCDRWFILSAKHGLVDPGTTLEPYDATLDNLGSEGRRRWSQAVLRSLSERLGTLADHEFEVHAGAAYAEFGLTDGLRKAGAAVRRPMAGLSLGEQLHAYGSAESMAVRTRPPGDRATTGWQGSHPALRPSTPVVGGKYEQLYAYLAARPGRVRMSFSEIDELVDGLPDSARRWRAWWANDPGHSQARTWLQAHHRVAAVHIHGERVDFV